MAIQLELWQALTLVGAFLTVVAGAGRMLAGQIDRRLTERFAAQEMAREDARRHWDEKFAEVARGAERQAAGLVGLERDLLQLKADLPVHYVRREDYVRGQTVIEAKLDALAVKLENTQLREAGRDRSAH